MPNTELKYFVPLWAHLYDGSRPTPKNAAKNLDIRNAADRMKMRQNATRVRNEYRACGPMRGPAIISYENMIYLYDFLKTNSPKTIIPEWLGTPDTWDERKEELQSLINEHPDPGPHRGFICINTEDLLELVNLYEISSVVTHA
jgi:hypothetical protein